MKRGLIDIYKLSLLLVVSAVTALSLAGCGGEGNAPDFPVEDDERISVNIALAGMGEKRDTRSNPGNDSDDTSGAYGSAAESYIDIYDLYVMTFSIPDGKTVLCDESQLLEILWKPGSRGKDESKVTWSGGYTYLQTQLDENIPAYSDGKDFCIVAIANFSKFGGMTAPTSGMEFSDLQKLAKFNYKPTKTGEWSWRPETDKNGIPLFGVKRVNLKGYDKKIHGPQNPYQLQSNGNPTVWLLRAFAKAEIRLSDALKNLELNGVKTEVKIKSASIGNSYSSDFWLIPELSRFSEFNETGGTGLINGAPTFNEWQSTKANPADLLSFNFSADATSATVYLPEYDMSAAENKPRITVTLEIGGSDQEFSFDFKPYPKDGDSSEGQPASWLYILRNNYYRFILDVDFRVITVEPVNWSGAFGNDFNFGDGQTTSPVKPWDDTIKNDYEF